LLVQLFILYFLPNPYNSDFTQFICTAAQVALPDLSKPSVNSTGATAVAEIKATAKPSASKNVVVSPIEGKKLPVAKTEAKKEAKTEKKGIIYNIVYRQEIF